MEVTMAKYKFEDFLTTVPEDNKDFVSTVHEKLQDNFKARMQTTKNGLSISYSMPKANYRLLGFSIRDSQLIVHINAENHLKYLDLLKELPKEMEEHIDDAYTCKKLIGKKCYDACEPGYDFYIGENHYQKCRYDCFKLKVDKEREASLLKIIESESKERVMGMIGEI
jgi:hypothetical protein